MASEPLGSEPLKPVRTKRFKKDVRTARKRGKDLSKLAALVRLLVRREALPPRYRDHSLKGAWTGYRDAHLESDWIVIYRIVDNELQLVRTGSHADFLE